MVKLTPVVSKGHRHRRRQQPSSVAVSTTHLLYNPKRDDVRLAQAVLMMAGESEYRVTHQVVLNLSLTLKQMFTFTERTGHSFLMFCFVSF